MQGRSEAGSGAFSSWLREELLARRMSSRHLAVLTGLDHSTITRLVRGDHAPSFDTVVRISGILGDGGHLAAFERSGANVTPISRVLRALRADDALSDGDVHRLMREYLASRDARRRPRTD